MAEIILPVSAPGQTEAAAGFDRVARSVKATGEAHKQQAAAAKEAARQAQTAARQQAADAQAAARAQSAAAAAVAQAHRDAVNRRIADLGRLRAAEQASDGVGSKSELDKLNEGLGKTLTKTALVGTAMSTIAAVGSKAFSEISANIEAGVKNLEVYRKAAAEAAKILTDATAKRDDAAAASLLKGGDNRRALIALGGEMAYDAATARAQAMGIDPEDAVAADIQLRRAGVSDEHRSAFYARAGELHRGGVQTFGESLKAAEALGGRLPNALDQQASDAREALANASAFASYHDARAADATELPLHEQMARYRAMVDARDADQRRGRRLTEALPTFSEFAAGLPRAPRAGFAGAAGRSAADIDAAMARTADSYAAADTLAAQQAEARRKVRADSAGLNVGKDAVAVAEARDRVEKLRPGVSALAQRRQEAEDRYLLEQQRTKDYQEQRPYHSGLGLFSDMGERRRAEESAFSELKAIGDKFTEAARELMQAAETFNAAQRQPPATQASPE